MNDKKIVLGAFIVVILILVMIYLNGGEASDVQKEPKLCSEGTLHLFLDVYYPGEITATGYEIKGDRIILRFRSRGSGDLRINRANFTITCIPKNLSPDRFEVSVDGKTFHPSCEGVLTTPVPSKTANPERSVYYLASPYNLGEIAIIELPEGHSFEELRLEDGTLIIEVSPGGSINSAVVRSELIGKNWSKVLYTDGTSTWAGQKSTMGRGTCPIWISPTS